MPIARSTITLRRLSAFVTVTDWTDEMRYKRLLMTRDDAGIAHEVPTIILAAEKAVSRGHLKKKIIATYKYHTKQAPS